MDHCRDEATFEKLVTMVNDSNSTLLPMISRSMKTHRRGKSGRYHHAGRQITWLYPESGSSVVVDVLRYGERLKTPGLNC